MSDTVWASILPKDTNLNFYFHDAEKELPYQQRSDFFEAINNGWPADLSLTPRIMHLDDDRKFRRKSLPRVFKSRMMYFSEPVYEVFKQFNCGKTVFSPVEFYGHGGHPKISDRPYFGVAFTDSHRTVDIAADDGTWVQLNRYDRTAPHHLALGLVDDVVPLVPDYPKDLDFWVDGAVVSCFFLSDRLHRALKRERLDRPFDAKRCRFPE